MSIILQRSMLERFEKCKRAGYWNYFHDGRGIEKKAMSLPALSGIMIHEPLAEVLLIAKNHGQVHAATLQTIIDYTKGKYIKQVQERGVLLDYFDSPAEGQLGKIENSPVAWQINEEIAALEAKVKGWARVRLPKLLEEFRIVDIETEQAFQVGSNTMLTRRDGLLERRSSGEYYVLSFKNTRNPDETWREGFRCDQQTISEFIAADATLREQGIEGTVRGIIVEGLVSGQRNLEWPPESEQKRYNSPLLYHYVEKGAAPFPDTYKSSLYYVCTEPHPHRWTKGGQCPGGKKHKHPDSFQRDMVSQTCGIDAWLDWLQENDPELLAAQFISLPAILRSEFDIERWKRTTKSVALDLQGRIDELTIRQRGTLGMTEEDLDEIFWMETHHGNCLRPGKCDYWDLCWGQADPDDLDLFVPRTFNHPAEAKLIQIGAAK